MFFEKSCRSKTCESGLWEYKKAAADMKHFVKVGAVDCEENKALCGEYKIKHQPTVRFFSGTDVSAFVGDISAKKLIACSVQHSFKLLRKSLRGETKMKPFISEDPSENQTNVERISSRTVIILLLFVFIIFVVLGCLVDQLVFTST